MDALSGILSLALMILLSGFMVSFVVLMGIAKAEETSKRVQVEVKARRAQRTRKL